MLAPPSQANEVHNDDNQNENYGCAQALHLNSVVDKIGTRQENRGFTNDAQVK